MTKAEKRKFWLPRKSGVASCTSNPMVWRSGIAESLVARLGVDEPRVGLDFPIAASAETR